ncbi:Glutaminyl-peptide cyclotransferase-like protein [Wickerhamiella sorbophila]|uniref:Peptide hydrolase n=1 Tax=Wickerhamiella sorbophila TaxID=45607 RepID=A0A2T0FE09_9ASCO|nr:Glutaminyl-peptide cyclotransferase-like protein [Wickerhamiella sorbophila]PRT53221.1 Glutaminyl-peptide cyclotransferase-like protein [Wickerhamiella sorbophila]
MLFLLAFLPICVALKDADIVKLVNNLQLDSIAPEGSILEPLLEVRPPGSLGIENVRKFLIREFESLNYTMTIDAFTADTPLGPIPMANLIAQSPATFETELQDHSLPPPWSFWGAHYDSKLVPEGMVGAIDSSVPCALMLFAAKALANAGLPAPPVKFVFFDGEEAIDTWTDTDSLYGARHYAENYELPPALVLFDLIGATPKHLMPSWFGETYSWHRDLARLNQKLVQMKLMKYMLVTDITEFHAMSGRMIDDHTPFWVRGVPCLHFIPPVFPPQWHTINDNAKNLDQQAVRDWAILVTTWLAHYQGSASTHDEL